MFMTLALLLLYFHGLTGSTEELQLSKVWQQYYHTVITAFTTQSTQTALLHIILNLNRQFSKPNIN